MKRILVLAATLAALSSPTFAATLTVNEEDIVNVRNGTADFDNALLPQAFGGRPATQNIGTMMAGSNSVSGSLSGTCTSNSCSSTSDDRQDSFRFTIANGFKVTGLNITMTNTLGTPIRFGFELTDTNNQPVNFLSLFAVSGTSYTTSTGDVGPGDYFFSIGARRDGGSVNNGTYAFDWNVQFTGESTTPTSTPPVPLPAGGLLLVAGLAALTRLRRKA